MRSSLPSGPSLASPAGRACRCLGAAVVVFLATAFAAGFWLTRRNPDPAVLGHYSVQWFMISITATLVTAVMTWFAVRTLLCPIRPAVSGRVRMPVWKRFLFLGIVLAIPLGCGELWLRHILRAALSDVQSPFQRWPTTGFHALLQVTSREQRGDRWVRTYRGRVVAPEKATACRIVCLGGSTTWGSDMPREATWPQRLEDHLRDAGFDVEVVNAGEPWYTSAHSLTKYIIQVRYLDPDIIIVMHGINDLHRSFSDIEGLPPEWDYGSSLGPMRDLFHAQTPRRADPRRTSLPTCVIWTLICEATHVDELYYSALRDRAGQPRDALLFALHHLRFGRQGSDPNTGAPGTVRSGVKRPELDIPTEAFVSIHSLKGHLDYLTQVAQADGVRVVLSTQAHVYRRPEAGSGDGPPQNMRLAFLRPDGVTPVTPDSTRRAMAAIRDQLFDISHRRGATIADAEAAVNGDPACFLDDFHLSVEGNRRVGEEMARTLEPLVRSIAASPTTVTP